MAAKRRARQAAATVAAMALVVVLSHDQPTPPAPEVPAAIAVLEPAPSYPPPLAEVRIPLAAPTHLAIPELDIDAAVEEYTNDQVDSAGGWVDPPRRDVVAWWSGGGTPGDPADNTVYLYGHVSRLSAVFNPLAVAASGQLILLTTAAGTLTYRVTEVLPPIPKSELPDVPEVSAAVPGRLLLIGCHRDPDQGRRPTTMNTVVIAEQVVSKSPGPVREAPRGAHQDQVASGGATVGPA